MPKKNKVLIEKETFLPFWLLITAIISAAIHNFTYGFLRVEEAVFFILALLLALGFFISVVYNVVTYINQGKPEDIWKMGWLGLFGLIGLLLFDPMFFGFFVFFAFFGLKRK